jgi:VCBS repeat-containing protein
MNQIGVVENLDGKFYVEDENGNLVELQNGDIITEGMKIVGDSTNSESSKCEISGTNEEAIVVKGSGEQVIDDSFVESFASNETDTTESSEDGSVDSDSSEDRGNSEGKEKFENEHDNRSDNDSDDDSESGEQTTTEERFEELTTTQETTPTETETTEDSVTTTLDTEANADTQQTEESVSDMYQATEDGSEFLSSDDSVDTENGIDDGINISDNLISNIGDIFESDTEDNAGESIFIEDDVEDDTTIETGSQDDTVFIGDDVNDEATVDTGAGNDTVYVGDDVADEATIDTGSGDDSVEVGDNVEDESTVDTGSGDDTVTIGDDLSDEATVDTGSGDDSVSVGDDVSDEATIDTGSGDDTVVVGDNVEGEASIDTGSGDDTVVVNDLEEGSNIDLGSGDDTLVVKDEVDSDTGTITGGSGNDTLVLENQDQSDWDDGMSEQFQSFETVTFGDGNTINLIETSSVEASEVTLITITVNGTDYTIDSENTQIILPHGTLSASPNGDFSYIVNNDNPSVQALNIGDSLNDSFSYTLSNGVDTYTSEVVINIDGRDDAPVIECLVGNEEIVDIPTEGASNLILEGINLSDVDDVNLEGATVCIMNYQDGDLINTDSLPDGITATMNDNYLTLSGSATISDYEAALKSLTFETTSNDTTPREFVYTVFDGDKYSNIESVTLNLQDTQEIQSEDSSCDINTFSISTPNEHSISHIDLYIKSGSEIIKVKIDNFEDAIETVYPGSFIQENYPDSELIAYYVKAGNNFSIEGIESDTVILNDNYTLNDLPVFSYSFDMFNFKFNKEYNETIDATYEYSSYKESLNQEPVCEIENEAPVAIDDSYKVIFESHADNIPADSGYAPDNSAITMTAWVQPSANGGSEFFGANDGSNHRFYMGSWENGDAQIGVGDNYVRLSDIKIPTDTPTHMALTMDNGKADFYVNGELVKSIEYNWVGESTTNIDFKSLNDTYDFDGELSNVKVLNGAMDADDISDIYNTEVNGQVWLPEVNLTTDEDTPLVIEVQDLLQNDSDIDGDSLTITNVTTTADTHGTVEIDSNGNIVYTPEENYNGEASFTYTINDGKGGEDTATVTLNVEKNEAPVAIDDSYKVIFESHADNIPADSGYAPDNSAITMTAWVQPSANGGSEFFGANDGSNHRFYMGSWENGDAQIGVGDNYVRLSDIKIPTDTPTHMALTMDNGKADFYVNGELVKSIEYNWVGESTTNIDFKSLNDTYDFDGELSNVKVLNGAMDADDISDIYNTEVNGQVWLPEVNLTTDEDTPLVIEVQDLLQNDSDIDGDSLTITNVTTTADTHGTVEIDSNGNIVYTPEENYNGEASFTYTINDGKGGEDTATVTLNVEATPDFIAREEQSIDLLKENSLDNVNTNLVITIDVSGSMAETDGIFQNNESLTKFELAKSTLINTIKAYDSQGSVNVNLTLFAANGKNIGWMDSDSAINYLENLIVTYDDGVYANGVLIDDIVSDRTDFYDAIQTTVSADLTTNDADKTIGLFISDGDVCENAVYVDSKDDIVIQDWKEFVNNNIDELNIIGVGKNVNNYYLDILQVENNSGAAIVSNNVELNEILINTSGETVTGSIIDNIDFKNTRFDKVLSVKVNNINYTEENFPEYGLETNGGGLLTVSFDTGNYTYVALDGKFNQDINDSFSITVVAANGKTVEVPVDINVDLTVIDSDIVSSENTVDNVELVLSIKDSETNIENSSQNDSTTATNLEDIEDVTNTEALVGDTTYEYDNMNNALYTNNDGVDVVEVNRDSNTIMTYGGDDVINVDGNQNGTIDAGEGNNRIDIDGNSNSIFVGDGNDQIRIAGSQNVGIDLNGGQNQIDVHGNANDIYAGSGGNIVNIGGHSNGNIDLESGNDAVTIAGNSSSVDLGSGDDTITIGGYVNNKVEGGDGTDSIVLENYTKSDWDSDMGGIQSKVVNFENIMFKDGEVIGNQSAFGISKTYYTTVNIVATQEDISENLSNVIVNIPDSITTVQDIDGNALSISNGSVSIEVESGVETSITLISDEPLSQSELTSINGSVSTEESAEINTAVDAVNYDVESDEYSFDIVNLDNDINLDFSDENLDLINDIEMIDMHNESANSIEGLSLDDVLEMTDDNNTLTIMGDDVDDINITTDGWTQESTTSNADTGITTYEYSNASGQSITLNIEDQIDSTGI